MKPMPVCSMQRATCSGVRSITAPNASSTSALPDLLDTLRLPCLAIRHPAAAATNIDAVEILNVCAPSPPVPTMRSEEHTSELQSLMRISYAVFCLKKKIKTIQNRTHTIKKNTHAWPQKSKNIEKTQ